VTRAAGHEDDAVSRPLIRVRLGRGSDDRAGLPDEYVVDVQLDEPRPITPIVSRHEVEAQIGDVEVERVRHAGLEPVDGLLDGLVKVRIHTADEPRERPTVGRENPVNARVVERTGSRDQVRRRVGDGPPGWRRVRPDGSVHGTVDEARHRQGGTGTQHQHQDQDGSVETMHAHLDTGNRAWEQPRITSTHAAS
jgi:hypothetical protein